jgi:hypothetical protein
VTLNLATPSTNGLTRRSRRALAWGIASGLAIAAALIGPRGASAFGTFDAAAGHPTTGGVAQAAFGDLDGDGALDVAAAHDSDTPGQDSVLVYFGNGDGTLDVPIPIGVGSAPEGVAIGRFNGDRRPDIAVASFADNSVSVLYTRRGGGFKHGPTLSVDSPYHLAAGDFNRDGRTDLASINLPTFLAPGTRSLRVWMQRRGGLGPAKDYNAPGEVHGLAVGRVNSDRRPDVVTHTYDGDIVVRLARQDGTLARKRVTHYGAHGGFADLAIADFNRDGKTDVASGDYAGGTLRVGLGRGNGRFRKAQPVDIAGHKPSGIVAGDFNRDGKPDLAVGSRQPAEMIVVRGNGNGGFASPSPAYPAGGESLWLGTARLNADRASDIVLGAKGSLDVFLNQP